MKKLPLFIFDGFYAVVNTSVSVSVRAFFWFTVFRFVMCIADISGIIQHVRLDVSN